MTNKNNSVLYVGVTSNLSKRVLEHKERFHPRSLTSKYNINKLVYYEGFDLIEDAIFREKQIKAGSRKDKIDLKRNMNPECLDLYETICGF